MMLFGPEAFQVGVSGNGGVGLVIHAGKVGDDKKIGMTEKRYDGVRCKLQDWMLPIRFQDPSFIKERSFRPPDHSPPITHHLHLIGPPNLAHLVNPLPTSQGPLSCSGSVFSHDPHWLLLPLVGHYCSLLSSWSGDPRCLLSSFNPYLSDPLTLLLLIHLSHDVVLPLFFLSHDIIVVLLILQS